MEINLKANLNRIFSRDLGYISEKMAKSMKGIGCKEKDMEKESIFIRMKVHLQEIGNITLKKGKELKLGKTVNNI